MANNLGELLQTARDALKKQEEQRLSPPHVEQVTKQDIGLAKMEDGDAFTEDTMLYLGNLREAVEIPLAVEIGIFYQNHWYVYKLDRRYKAEDEDTEVSVDESQES